MSRLRYLEISPREAINFLAFVLGWNGGELPVFLDGSAVPSLHLPCKRGLGDRLWERALGFDLRRGAQVEIGLPLKDGCATVLWAWSRSPESTFRAARFRPEPAMVLRFGKGAERLMLWGLREPVPYVSIEPANERISYALHAPRTCCRPEKLRIPLPGTFLRVGRERPAPVLVTRRELSDYTRSQVADGLKDPPPRDAWRERKSA